MYMHGSKASAHVASIVLVDIAFEQRCQAPNVEAAPLGAKGRSSIALVGRSFQKALEAHRGMSLIVEDVALHEMGLPSKRNGEAAPLSERNGGHSSGAGVGCVV